MGQEAVPLGPANSLPLPRSFLLKSSEQVRKIQAQGAMLQEKLVSERLYGIRRQKDPGES
jgi:hypothetical protein